MKIYPKVILNSVADISVDFLQKNKINALILDVDNTLINIERIIPENTKKWVKCMKENNIKLYILSNTNNKKKVEDVSNALEIPYRNLAKKPSKKGFIKVQEILQEKPENIGVVGDQIFTDVIGGNRANMFTILVEPIQKKEYWYTRWKRPIEDIVKNKFKKQQENNKNQN
ncbi:MAG: YqeG family HAD IIIA-type phosphatase [Clostridia bacterium]|nr:YqeG family HAD IIIA-type phosphatase [Clostridia bacterium]